MRTKQGKGVRMVHMEEFLWKRYMEDMEHVFLDALAFVSDQHRVVLAKALTAIFAEDAPFELSDENILAYLKSTDAIKRQIFIKYGYFEPRFDLPLQELVLCIDDIKEPLLKSIKLPM